MWAVFIFIMGIVGVILINIFGNITTTNQQDYNLIRNTVEASMYDSIDKASYRAGFYLCIKPGVDITRETVEFTSKNNYDLVLNTTNLNIDSVSKNYSRCDYLVGEVKLNADVFVESFLRRFAETTSLATDYTVSFYGIYEAPPKASVEIKTTSRALTVVGDSTQFDMVERIDSIVEGNKLE